MQKQNLCLTSVRLPAWLEQEVALGQILATEEERMTVAINLAARQVKEGSGGPFGAVVCNLDSGEVIGIGVNQVTASGWSAAHAEFVAWTMAQETRRSYDLGAEPVGLYTSAQPCVSCWGGLFWTGIARLVYAATKHDVEQYAGFDEGPVPADWQDALVQRGVTVQGSVLRSEAILALKEYRQLGGEQYNASLLKNS